MPPEMKKDVDVDGNWQIHLSKSWLFDVTLDLFGEANHTQFRLLKSSNYKSSLENLLNRIKLGSYLGRNKTVLKPRTPKFSYEWKKIVYCHKI